MSLTQGLLNQTAVYWSTPVADGLGGFTYAAPVQIACRWQEAATLNKTGDGETKPDAVEVWSTTAMEEGGMLFYGTLADLSTAEELDPEAVSAARRITRIAVGRDLDGTIDHYKATI